jgi:Zn-dependent protease
MFIELLWKSPDVYITFVVVMAFSICVHEFSHAWAALSQGDETAARQGYLTLNPLHSMGMQSLMFLLVLGFAWGSVPVNPGAMRRRWSHALVSLSGPVANLVLGTFFAVLCGALTALAPDAAITSAMRTMLVLGAGANYLLFMLNMLPIPMLDGWEVYSFLVPAMHRLPPSRRGEISLIAILVIFLSPLGGWLWDTALYGMGPAVIRTAGTVFSRLA